MNRVLLDIFFGNTNSIAYFERVVYYLKIQNYSNALKNIAMGTESLSRSVNGIAEMNDYFPDNIFEEKLFNEILCCVEESQITKNYILLDDCYNKRLLPMLYKMQEYIILNEENLWAETRNGCEALYNNFNLPLTEEAIPGQFISEFATSGSATIRLKLNSDSRYLHSNVSPLLETFQLINDWYDETKDNYIIYGLGMGYHVSMIPMIGKNICVHLFESNSSIIKAVHENNAYNLYSDIDNIHINYDPDLTKLQHCLENMSEDTKFVVYYPSLYYIKEKVYYDKMEKLLKKYCTDQVC